MAADRPQPSCFCASAQASSAASTWRDFADDVAARVEELKAEDKSCMAILCDGSYECVREIFAPTCRPADCHARLCGQRHDAGPAAPYVDADTLWCANPERAKTLSNALVGTKVDGAAASSLHEWHHSRQKAVPLPTPA
jgi:hypothetical protein